MFILRQGDSHRILHLQRSYLEMTGKHYCKKAMDSGYRYFSNDTIKSCNN